MDRSQDLSRPESQGIAPSQCRAARGLLGLTQPDLARIASVSLATVEVFERNATGVAPLDAYALRVALEAAGIDFLDGHGCRVGVRFARSAGPRKA